MRTAKDQNGRTVYQVAGGKYFYSKEKAAAAERGRAPKSAPKRKYVKTKATPAQRKALERSKGVETWPSPKSSTKSIHFEITPGISPTARGALGNRITSAVKRQFGGTWMWEFGETGLGHGEVLSSAEGWEYKGPASVTQIRAVAKKLAPKKVRITVNGR